MAKKGKTRYVLLGLLSESPLSGYDIKKLVENRFSFFWKESFGQIYPVLVDLEKDELVSMQSISNGEKARNIYSITAKGMNELKAWLSEPVETEINRYEILLKVYFGNLTGQENIIDYIKEFKFRHTKNLKLMEKYEKDLKDVLLEHENHNHVLMTILFGKKVFKAYIEWCDEILPMIQDTKVINPQ